MYRLTCDDDGRQTLSLKIPNGNHYDNYEYPMLELWDGQANTWYVVVKGDRNQQPLMLVGLHRHSNILSMLQPLKQYQIPSNPEKAPIQDFSMPQTNAPYAKEEPDEQNTTHGYANVVNTQLDHNVCTVKKKHLKSKVGKQQVLTINHESEKNFKKLSVDVKEEIRIKQEMQVNGEANAPSAVKGDPYAEHAFPVAKDDPYL